MLKIYENFRLIIKDTTIGDNFFKPRCVDILLNQSNDVTPEQSIMIRDTINDYNGCLYVASNSPDLDSVITVSGTGLLDCITLDVDEITVRDYKWFEESLMEYFNKTLPNVVLEIRVLPVFNGHSSPFEKES